MVERRKGKRGQNNKKESNKIAIKISKMDKEKWKAKETKKKSKKKLLDKKKKAK